MPFCEEQRQALALLIATEVPYGLLLDFAYPGVKFDIDNWRKAHAAEPDSGKLAVARKIIEATESRYATAPLATFLYRRLFRDEGLAQRLAEYTIDPAHHQALLAPRDPAMNLAALRRFEIEAAYRICLIVAVVEGHGSLLGTGFLVGPDLVITAYHTLVFHIVDGTLRTPAPGKCCAIFDFFEGPGYGHQNLTLGRRVEFAADWLRGSSVSFPFDGTIADPDTATQVKLQESLDFALVQLAEPVGLEACPDGDGKRRGWFSFDNSRVDLVSLDRLVVPQHPGGLPQRIDFGIFKDLCKSQTRVRYEISTEQGTSGAPCFRYAEGKFHLVAMHNAAYTPHKGAAALNQAIRFDHIHSRISVRVQEPSPVDRAKLWNVAPLDASTDEPVLGRQALMDWIDRAVDDASQPAFACLGDHKRSGRSFSVKILRAMRRNADDRIASVGGRNTPIPSLLDDFIRTILDQIAVRWEQIETMPPRPHVSAGAGEQDKLNAWASKDIPNWLNALIASQRKIPDTPARWQRTWIAVRLERPEELSSEVENFIARMLRPDLDAPLEEASGFRWLFIGHRHKVFDHLPPSCTEVLDPMSIGASDMVLAVKAMFDRLGRSVPREGVEMIAIIIEGFLQGELCDPSSRLAGLQAKMSNVLGVARAVV